MARLELFADAHLQRRATGNSNELGASTTRFLEHCRVARCLAAKTRLAYRADLGAFASHFGSERPAGEIEREDVVSYVKQIQDVRGLRPASARRKLEVVLRMAGAGGRDHHKPFSPQWHSDSTTEEAPKDAQYGGHACSS